MKRITLGTLKGGVGKTMLSFNIGGILSEKDKKVLIIDNDLQGNLTNNIGVDRTNPLLKTTYDIYNTETNQPHPKDIVLKAPNNALPNLDLIAGSIFLHRAELKLGAVAGREWILKNYLEDYPDFFEQYDYVIIDTNPSMGIVNQNAFTASDSIILVSDVSMNALEGAQLFIALWEESRKRLRVGNNIKAFVINDFDARNKLSTDFLEYVNSDEDLADIREIKAETVIPRTVKITESELAALPINLYDRYSKGCKAIEALVEELLEKQVL